MKIDTPIVSSAWWWTPVWMSLAHMVPGRSEAMVIFYVGEAECLSLRNSSRFWFSDACQTVEPTLIFLHTTSTCISTLLSVCLFFPHRDSFLCIYGSFFSFYQCINSNIFLLLGFNQCITSNIFCSWGLNTEMYRITHYIRVQRHLKVLQRILMNLS